MHLLVIGVNSEHGSKIDLNIYNALDMNAEVDYYGPGFSAGVELKAGLKDYLKKQETGYDAIIVTHSFLKTSWKMLPIRDVYFQHRFLMSDYSVTEAIRYSERILEDLINIDCVKIIEFIDDIVYLEKKWDIYLRGLLDCGFYFMAPGTDFITEANEKECFGLDRLTNYYLRIVNEYYRKVLSIYPIAASSDEFYYGPMDRRAYDFVVPGNIDYRYPTRRFIMNIVEESGLKVFNNYMDRKLQYKEDESRVNNCRYYSNELKEIHKYFDTPYIRADIPRETIASWREKYNISIRQSKIAYTDGGTANNIIRKYVEIPARRTALFCGEVCGMDKFGFVNGLNAVFVTADNVSELVREYIDNAEALQRLADQGQRLIREKHTCQKRAIDILKSISAILNGSFGGSYWMGGDYYIDV